MFSLELPGLSQLQLHSGFVAEILSLYYLRAVYHSPPPHCGRAALNRGRRHAYPVIRFYFRDYAFIRIKINTYTYKYQVLKYLCICLNGHERTRRMIMIPRGTAHSCYEIRESTYLFHFHTIFGLLTREGKSDSRDLLACENSRIF